jgi:hypothetical protein
MNRLPIVSMIVALSLFLIPRQALACSANGVACTTDGQCCTGNCDPYQGRCGLANGTACTSNSDCAGEVCASSTTHPSCDNVCVSGAGLPCRSNSDCVNALYYCDSSNVCVAAGDLGATGCTSNYQCVTQNCVTPGAPNPNYCGNTTGNGPCDAQLDCSVPENVCDEECTAAGWCCIGSGAADCTSGSQCCSGTCISGTPNHCQ